MRMRIPAPADFASATLAPPAAHWDAVLGEFILDWDDVREGPHPYEAALDFARSAVRHACTVCSWDPRWLQARTESRRRSTS